MNRRRFLQLGVAAMAAKALPLGALSVVAPEIVAPLQITPAMVDRARVDMLDLNNWGKVKYGTPPFWFGLPYWMDSAHTSNYAGISRNKTRATPNVTPE